jgi:hypothetical protein
MIYCHAVFLRWNSELLFLFRLVTWDCVHLALWPLIGILYQTRMMDYDKCGAVGGMIERGNRSTRRIPDPVPYRTPQIPHDLTRARNRAADAVGSQRITAWTTALPTFRVTNGVFNKSQMKKTELKKKRCRGCCKWSAVSGFQCGNKCSDRVKKQSKWKTSPCADIQPYLQALCEARYALKVSLRSNNLQQTSMQYNETLCIMGHVVTKMVEAICYKPGGRGFNSHRRHWIF